MYEKSVAFYDAIYDFKDYKTEADKVHTLIQQHKRTDGNTLLDVACGTGAHDVYLREYYTLEGLDLNAEMIKIASQRLPEITFHQGDMRDFDLAKPFDAITCLFSSIGFTGSIEALHQTICNFTHHLKPGGVIVVEPWLRLEDIRLGYVGIQTTETPEMKIVRMSQIEIQGRISTIHSHHLVGTAEGLHHFTEDLDLMLFTDDEYKDAFRAAGLQTIYDEQGLIGRGLFIGLKPLG